MVMTNIAPQLENEYMESYETLDSVFQQRTRKPGNQVDADTRWVACTEELIRRTRNKKKYSLVFKGLVEYGFRRNLLGLKLFGLPICVLSLIACAWSVWETWNSNEIAAVGVSTTLLSVSLILVWLFWVREGTVFISANRYARFLLEAALELD